ncbi:DUF58 domain-containing protein [Enterococcus sp. HY326]|uniref:DUF58 domain-containing protein n=1 Tax=Enterococcus sp. HY326 TaxID=2971265 RepID=UPI00223F1489|nr:DUF58 domain-containing protein [Enterococcus sp. HY326]
MKWLRFFFKLILTLLLFAFLIFYAAAFNTQIGWSLLFFFGLLFLINLLTILPFLRKITFISHDSVYSYRFQPLKMEVLIEKMGSRLLPFGKLFINFPEWSDQTWRIVGYRGKRQQLEVTIQAKERGVYHELPLKVTATDLVELFSKTQRIQMKQELIVLPEVKAEAYLLLRNFKTSQKLSLIGENNFSIKSYRDYRPGDPLKNIDWKLSSKERTLVYREQEMERPSEVVLVFWGQAAAEFEESLSWYYSLQKLLAQNANFYQIIVGQQLKTGTLIETETFATIKPFTETPVLPKFKGSQVLVITPVQTPELVAFLQENQRRKKIQVLDIKQIQQLTAVELPEKGGEARG